MTKELLQILCQVPTKECLCSGNTHIEKEIYNSDTSENEEVFSCGCRKTIG